jgi:hypothetical protein
MPRPQRELAYEHLSEASEGYGWEGSVAAVSSSGRMAHPPRSDRVLDVDQA